MGVKTRWASMPSSSGCLNTVCVATCPSGGTARARTSYRAGLCCVVERRGAQYTRAAHIRMPDVLRRFKMTQMTKEALLHSMAHAFLFLNGHTKEDQAFKRTTRRSSS